MSCIYNRGVGRSSKVGVGANWIKWEGGKLNQKSGGGANWPNVVFRFLFPGEKCVCVCVCVWGGLYFPPPILKVGEHGPCGPPFIRPCVRKIFGLVCSGLTPHQVGHEQRRIQGGGGTGGTCPPLASLIIGPIGLLILNKEAQGLPIHILGRP